MTVDANRVSDDLIAAAMDCDAWPADLWHIVNEVTDNDDQMSTEQAVALGVLLAHRSPSLSGREVVLYGPYGWLNGHRGLSEDSWGLENDPVADSGEYFAIPLFAKVDPFVEAGLEASPAPLEGVKPTHRHKKRGTEYVLIGYGKIQSEDWWSSGKYPERVDMHEVAIYRSATDPTEIWVRPREEFEDGRFEALSAIVGSAK